MKKNWSLKGRHITRMQSNGLHDLYYRYDINVITT